jgi:hypothetical protein
MDIGDCSEYERAHGSRLMSFQAYLDNIHKKTGKSPDEFFA